MISSAAAISAYDHLQTAALAEMRNLLKSKELEGVSTTPIVEEGSPTVEICSILDKQEIDLVVIGTHGRTGLNRFVMGSIAEQICRSTTCPVLTVGPNVEKKKFAAYFSLQICHKSPWQ
jgi:nucleotide-binding universal stress UspA family protein